MSGNGHNSTLPFGYEPNNVRGMGLPTYITNQPPPPGRPLLNEQENDHMQNFFTSMAADGQLPGQQMVDDQFHDMSEMHSLQLPNTYVGHDTFMEPQHAMQWHTPHMSNYHFGQPMNHLPASSYNANGHLVSPSSTMFPGQGHHQHHPQHHLQPQFATSWQQTFPPHPPQARTEMQFGSDPHFMHTGYAAPDGTMEADISLLAYAMHPTSSASNTQPNSRPGSNANTEPSSPAVPKKRKLNVFQTDTLRMTSTNGKANGNVVDQASLSSRKARRSFVNDQPPTPVSKPPTAFEDEDEDDVDNEDDADFDDDDVENHGASPADKSVTQNRSASKASASKATKARKKSTASNAAGPKALRRQSTGPVGAVSRVPLTAEQKKANHTNSEQRRRDATSKAYADLYDLVPETEEGGKASTMKKMGVVVTKVKAVAERLAYLRQLINEAKGNGQMGQHVATGAANGVASTWSLD